MKLVVTSSFHDNVHGVCVELHYPDVRSLLDFLPDYIVGHGKSFLFPPHAVFFIPNSVIPSSGSRPPDLVVFDSFSLAHVDLLESLSVNNNNQTNRK